MKSPAITAFLLQHQQRGAEGDRHAAPRSQGWQHSPWNRPKPGQAPVPRAQPETGLAPCNQPWEDCRSGLFSQNFCSRYRPGGSSPFIPQGCKANRKDAALPPSAPAQDPAAGDSLLLGSWGISAPPFPAADALPGYVKSSDHTLPFFFYQEE